MTGHSGDASPTWGLGAGPPRAGALSRTPPLLFRQLSQCSGAQVGIHPCNVPELAVLIHPGVRPDVDRRLHGLIDERIPDALEA